MTQFGSADGVGISYGNASPVLRGAVPVTASGTVQSVGSALASVAYPVAAMSAFGLYDITASDPIRTRVVASSEGSDVSGTWNRYWVSGTAPTEIRAGNGDGAILARAARRAAVQVKYVAVPNAEFHYLDAVQFEKSASVAGTPTAYEEPRTIKINMQADRVNLVKNPNFVLASPGASNQVTWANDSTIFKYGPNSGRLVSSSALADCYAFAGGTFYLKSGHTYTWSVWVYSVKDTWLDVAGMGLKETISSRLAATGSKFTQIYGGVWNRISGTGTLPTDWAGMTTLFIRPARDSFNSQYDTTNPLWYSGILVEEGSEVRDYFDGSFPSVDYIWENGALDTTNGSRSHLYRAFRAKQYRIDDIISKHVPHGIPYKITYAAIPSGLT